MGFQEGVGGELTSKLDRGPGKGKREWSTKQAVTVGKGVHRDLSRLISSTRRGEAAREARLCQVRNGAPKGNLFWTSFEQSTRSSQEACVLKDRRRAELLSNGATVQRALKLEIK